MAAADYRLMTEATGQRIAAALEALPLDNTIADAYSSSATYAVGDYCIYNNTLYKCNTAITTAEAWTPAHWTATSITEEFIPKSDVVNNLTSTATDKPLSANMGKALNGKLTCSGYMEWNNITLNSGSWATHTGNVSSGVKPSGETQQNAYNLSLDVAGTYLVIYRAEIEDSTNKTGLRGIRQYVKEINIHELFFAPSGNNTTCEASCIVHSDGSNTVRMGVYQSSGSSVTVTNIRVMAVMLLRD